MNTGRLSADDLVHDFDSASALASVLARALDPDSASDFAVEVALASARAALALGPVGDSAGRGGWRP
jgi:hypothetical protein